MGNKYILNIYPLAQADIENILQYISITLCNPLSADKLIQEFMTAMDLVCYNPKMYPLISNKLIKDKSLRKLLVKNYILFYRTDDDKKEIQVVRVFHGMMNYEKFL